MSRIAKDLQHVPPHSEEAEKAILGCILMNPKTFDEVSGLTGEHFYVDLHRKIWECIYALGTANELIDTITVSTVAKSRGWGEIVSTYSITMVMADACIPIRISSYAKIVSNAYTLRQARYVGDSLVEQSLAAEKTSERVLSDHITQMEQLAAGFGTDCGPRPLSGLFDEWITDQNSVTEPGLPTGLDDLDTLLGGWQRTDLVVLAARPGMGKTGFALSTMRHAAKRGKRVLMFSLEMGHRQLVGRLIAQEADIDLTRAQQHRLSESDWNNITQHAPLISDWDIHVDDEPGIHINTLVSRARRLHRQSPIDLIVVDYLQLVDGRDGGKGGNRDQELGVISRGLKGLAKTLDTPVICLAQLSREVEKRPSRRPQLSDLRESGNTEQDADVVTFLMRPEYYGMQMDDGSSSNGLAQVIVAKHRNGPLGEFSCLFDGPRTLFTNPAAMFAGGQF